ncbi:hypothetical protein E4U53_006771 [Claviceps sorghi]|nr:hypothetical protein E4U53_006771 [Claviceps sorghi]
MKITIVAILAASFVSNVAFALPAPGPGMIADVDSHSMRKAWSRAAPNLAGHHCTNNSKDDSAGLDIPGKCP